MDRLSFWMVRVTTDQLRELKTIRNLEKLTRHANGKHSTNRGGARAGLLLFQPSMCFRLSIIVRSALGLVSLQR
jgi:hypothetical protein